MKLCSRHEHAILDSAVPRAEAILQSGDSLHRLLTRQSRQLRGRRHPQVVEERARLDKLEDSIRGVVVMALDGDLMGLQVALGLLGYQEVCQDPVTVF